MLQTCRQQGHICHRVFSWSELTLFLLAHGGGLSLLGVRHHLFGREVHLSHLCNAQLRRASPEGGNKRGQRNKQTKQTESQINKWESSQTKMSKSTAPKPNIHTTITKWHYCLTCSFGKHLLHFISNTWEYRETHVRKELLGPSTKWD